MFDIKRIVLSGLMVATVIFALVKLLNRQVNKQNRRQETSSKKDDFTAQASEKVVPSEQEFATRKANLSEVVTARHQDASGIINDSLATISANEKKTKELEEKTQKNVVISNTKNEFDDMFNKLNGL